MKTFNVRRPAFLMLGIAAATLPVKAQTAPGVPAEGWKIANGLDLWPGEKSYDFSQEGKPDVSINFKGDGVRLTVFVSENSLGRCEITKESATKHSSHYVDEKSATGVMLSREVRDSKDENIENTNVREFVELIKKITKDGSVEYDGNFIDPVVPAPEYVNQSLNNLLNESSNCQPDAKISSSKNKSRISAGSRYG